MGTCVDCSGEGDPQKRVGIGGNVNPLDCNNQFMQCGNPCHAGPKNTPQCESLPSQISNFTAQFFGQVIKTEVNGEVVWSLPCSLDVGLPNNPRGVDEGLACYFLRLFRDGIGGLTGPQGSPGAPGVDGANTYSVTLQSFVQPTINSPLTQVVISPNPVFFDGVGIFIQNSGSYQVTNVAPGGVLFVTLISPLPSALSVIPAGSFVVPVGNPGAGVGPPGPQGLTGPQGPQGLPGIPGTNLTQESGMYSAISSSGALVAGATDYTVTGSWATVDFVAVKPGFTPVGAATYLVTGSVSFTGQAGSTSADIISLRLITSDGILYYKSLVFANTLAVGQVMTLPISAVIQTTGTAGQQVLLQAYTTNASQAVISAMLTKLSWVRIA